MIHILTGTMRFVSLYKPISVSGVVADEFYSVSISGENEEKVHPDLRKFIREDNECKFVSAKSKKRVPIFGIPKNYLLECASSNHDPDMLLCGLTARAYMRQYEVTGADGKTLKRLALEGVDLISTPQIPTALEFEVKLFGKSNFTDSDFRIENQDDWCLRP